MAQGASVVQSVYVISRLAWQVVPSLTLGLNARG
jgi:hypothetical protein